MFREIIDEMLRLNIDMNANKLDIYINRSIYIIKNYLNDENLEDTYILSKYKYAVMELSMRAYKSDTCNASGVKSMTQGQRSVSYDVGLTNPYMITDDLKALLPPPKVRLL